MRIFLGDLGHYTVKLTNNHTPLNIGFIAAYLKKHLQENVEIELFKDPRKLFDEIESSPPDLLALSNYVWCQSVSEDAFKYYKKVKPDGIALWGGPNFPMNEERKARQDTGEGWRQKGWKWWREKQGTCDRTDRRSCPRRVEEPPVGSQRTRSS